MKKPHSQRRRINDPATPNVRLSGRYMDPTLEFEVYPVGRKEKEVSFSLALWQWKELVRHVDSARSIASERLATAANQWKPTP